MVPVLNVDATSKADTVFLPVLENAEKASKLRSTLGVFDRSKFFFNLPGSLLESIEAGRYDAALRDYKKGKYLLESRPGQLLPTTAGGSSTETQQKRIFDKVWGAVEKVMDQMKTILLNRLKEPSRSLEDHEKTIEYDYYLCLGCSFGSLSCEIFSILLELSNSDGPIWVYFDSQHKHILQRVETTYKIARARVMGKPPEAFSPLSDFRLINYSRPTITAVSGCGTT
jgi:exocyst complex component 2